jgi:alkylhydroperoxidase family enzyme
MLEAGSISVRGLKATIEAALVKGSLPTIKPSTAQYFKLSGKVRALSGGKDKALKDVLNATIQAKRQFGKEAEAKISEAKSFAELVKSTPKQGEKAKAERATLADVKAVMATADGVIALALKALRELSGDEAVINIGENARALINFLNVGLGITRHPSARAKVAA